VGVIDIIRMGGRGASLPTDYPPFSSYGYGHHNSSTY